MFWDRVAGIYDLFANLYNKKANKNLCKEIENMIDSNDEVLECACGTGMLSVCIAPKCKILIATDFSYNMLKKAKEKCRTYSNVEFKQMDIMNMDYSDFKFDKVVAANVIHLLDEPYEALKNLDRVCRNGGKIIIPTYISSGAGEKSNLILRLIKKMGADFKKNFTYCEYKKFFLEAGYTDIKYIVVEGRVDCAIAVITKK